MQGDALTFRTSEDLPIVFPEWSPINGNMIKRRDYAYGELLYHTHVGNLPLFSDCGEDVYLPTPVADFPPCHYLNVSDAEAVHERT